MAVVWVQGHTYNMLGVVQAWNSMQAGQAYDNHNNSDITGSYNRSFGGKFVPELTRRLGKL